MSQSCLHRVSPLSDKILVASIYFVLIVWCSCIMFVALHLTASVPQPILCLMIVTHCPSQCECWHRLNKSCFWVLWLCCIWVWCSSCYCFAFQHFGVEVISGYCDCISKVMLLNIVNCGCTTTFWASIVGFLLYFQHKFLCIFVNALTFCFFGEW